MPSPLAHSLAGLAIAHALASERERSRPSWYVLAVVAANAPDLDFAAGLVTGSINALHGGATHSVTGALLFAALTASVLALRGVSGWRLPFLGLCAYLSHVLLDMGCEPSPSNPGMTVLWPLTDERFLLPWRPLPGIAHGHRSGGVAEFLDELLSTRNLPAAAVELAVFAPLLALVVWARGVRGARTAPLACELQRVADRVPPGPRP